MRALRKGRDNNPAHENAFNSLISDLKRRKIRIGIGSQLSLNVCQGREDNPVITDSSQDD